MEIIRKRQRHEQICFAHSYSWDKPRSGWGFSFDCDSTGKIDESALADAGRANLALCRAGKDETGRTIVDDGIVSWPQRYTEPAAGRCSCGQTVTLDDPMDNHCTCGKCYNMSGQEVIPSHLLHDETGEYLHGDY